MVGQSLLATAREWRRGEIWGEKIAGEKKTSREFQIVFLLSPSSSSPGKVYVSGSLRTQMPHQFAHAGATPHTHTFRPTSALHTDIGPTHPLGPGCFSHVADSHGLLLVAVGVSVMLDDTRGLVLTVFMNWSVGLGLMRTFLPVAFWGDFEVATATSGT